MPNTKTTQKNTAARAKALESLHKGAPPGWNATAGASSEDLIPVVPVVPGTDGTVRLGPARSAERGANKLRKLAAEGRVSLPEGTISAIALAALDPSELAAVVPFAQHTSDGWLDMIRVRMLTPCLNVALTNDRLLGQSVYEADPLGAGTDRTALAQATSDERFARLVHDDSFTVLAASADRNAKRVLDENRQDVGTRPIERPLTAVVHVLSPGTPTEVELFEGVDGNSRLGSAFENLEIRREWLPAHLAHLQVQPVAPLRPSILLSMDAEEKRMLVRRIAKDAEETLAIPEPSAGSESERATWRRRHNAAAAAMNSLTAPVDLIVGFRPHGPSSDFATAVRWLLLSMNVAPSGFSEASSDAVLAEEIVHALFAEGALTSQAEVDALIGRSGVAAAMKAIGLDPSLPDLRFAFVVHCLTRPDTVTRAVFREKLGKPGGVMPHERSGVVAELGLRGYSATLGDGLKQVRGTLAQNGVWGNLVTRWWRPENVVSDEDVDILALLAEDERANPDGPQGCLLLLGVLGLVALTTTGHLLAPGGSAENLVGGQKIDRGSSGHIVEGLCAYDWGLLLLAEAIKAGRRGDAPVWVGPPTPEGSTAPDTSAWKGADFNAQLRLAVRNGGRTQPIATTGAAREDALWGEFCDAVSESVERLRAFEHERNENGTTERVSLEKSQAVYAQLGDLLVDVTTIAKVR